MKIFSEKEILYLWEMKIDNSLQLALNRAKGEIKLFLLYTIL